MKVAFAGLGVMGFPMAGHLARAGHEMSVFNRSPDKARALGQHGAAVAQGAADAVKHADFVMTMLADGEAVAALVAKGALNGVHFQTDDLDATFERVRASGAEIVQEPTEQFWGTRDFAVRDPSGNLVRIDQPPAAS